MAQQVKAAEAVVNLPKVEEEKELEVAALAAAVKVAVE